MYQVSLILTFTQTLAVIPAMGGSWGKRPLQAGMKPYRPAGTPAWPSFAPSGFPVLAASLSASSARPVPRFSSGKDIRPCRGFHPSPLLRPRQICDPGASPFLPRSRPMTHFDRRGVLRLAAAGMAGLVLPTAYARAQQAGVSDGRILFGQAAPLEGPAAA